MPTTEPNPAALRRRAARVSRRAALSALSAALLAAEPSAPPARIVAELSGALSAGDAVAAMDCFSRAARDYDEIENLVRALTAQTDLSCSVELVAESGSGDTRELDTDWLMQLTARSTETAVERRRERVRIQVRAEKNRWRVTALAPLGILNPIRIPEPRA